MQKMPMNFLMLTKARKENEIAYFCWGFDACELLILQYVVILHKEGDSAYRRWSEYLWGTQSIALDLVRFSI